MIRLLILSLLAISNAYAQRSIGQDYLGAQSPNCRIITAAAFVEQGTSFGILDWTFGEGTKKIEDYLTRVQPKYFRIHLLNGPCVRGGNCGKYEPVYGYRMGTLDAAIREGNKKLIGHVKARTTVYRNIAKRHVETKFLLSPILEHNLSSAAWKVLADTVKRIWPEVQLVNNPMSATGERYRGAWIEGHGQKGRLDAEINSLDGDSASDIDIEAWKERFKNVKILYVHDRLYNGRLASGAWIDPRVRTAFPKTFQFEELAHITDRRRSAPTTEPIICKIINRFVAPNIWKQFAENKGTGDARAGYPVALSNFGNADITIIAENGTEIGTLGYYGVYNNELRRHYSAWKGGSHLNGYTFEKLAKEKSGSPWTYLMQNGKCLGPIITGMRQGLMR